MTSFIEIDGSYHESGGQILRTSLSLSALLQKPFSISNIRAKRNNPGLQAQHLTAVNACAQLSGAAVEGATLHSTQLSFSPAETQPGNHSFDVGTAGSTVLVLQTLLPVCLFAQGESKLSLQGGTENAFAPTSLYFKHAFLPAIMQMGAKLSFEVERFGWYPKGGGKVQARVEPLELFKPLNLAQRGARKGLKGFAVSSGLPSHVAERMKARALKQLSENGIEAKVELHDLPAVSAGAEFFLLAQYQNAVAGFSALGERAKPSEKVAGEAIHEFLEFEKSGAAFDAHLADQLLLYAALAKGESVFTVEKVTGHLLTNAFVIRQFLPECEIGIDGEEGEVGKVGVKGIGFGATG